jgi:hypothetical protein
MGMRSGTTFKKRQKELARMEKQRDKVARRLQRKADKLNGVSTDNDADLEAPLQDLAAPLNKEGDLPEPSAEPVTVPAHE